MASFISIGRRSGHAASLISRATTKHLSLGECSSRRALPAARAFGTSCLARPNKAQVGDTLTKSSLLSTANKYHSQLQVQRSLVRWKSEESTSPTFREWGFEDINAALPSTTPTSPSQKPRKNLILVDVREPAEMNATGIIPSAVAVPLASQPDALFLTPDEFETRFGYPKPGIEEMAAAAEAGERGPDVVFYCKAGVRARAAAQLAAQAGYDPERIGVYEGSWLDWAGKGGKVEKWEGPDYE